MALLVMSKSKTRHIKWLLLTVTLTLTVSLASVERLHCHTMAGSTNFYDMHPNIITAGLRRRDTGQDISDWSLMVYSESSIPLEALIPNVKPSEDANYLSIRLFLKANKTMIVVYQSADQPGNTIMAEYRLERHQIVPVSVFNTGQIIEPWRVVDSDEGFYDSTTCQLLKPPKTALQNCRCSATVEKDRVCFYDYIRDKYYAIENLRNILLPVYNYYNCLFFHEIGSGGKRVDPSQEHAENISALAFASDKPYLEPGDSAACVRGPSNFRQLQFYDFNWDDVPRKDWRECDVFHIAELMNQTRRDVDEANKADDQNKAKKENRSSSEKISELADCWEAIALFGADGVIFLACIVACYASRRGRRIRGMPTQPKPIQ